MPHPPRRRTVLTAFVGTAGAAVACSPDSSRGGAGGPAPGMSVRTRTGTGPAAAATAAARRLLPDHWEQIAFRTVPSDDDVFRVSGKRGHIVVSGPTAGVQLTGLRHYLQHTAHASITWAGDQLDLGRGGELVGGDVEVGELDRDREAGRAASGRARAHRAR